MKKLLTIAVGIVLTTIPLLEPVQAASYDHSNDHRARCRVTLKNRLKDPDSFKQHDYGRFMKTGVIEYSATNSFGARLRSTFDCKASTLLSGKPIPLPTGTRQSQLSYESSRLGGNKKPAIADGVNVLLGDG